MKTCIYIKNEFLSRFYSIKDAIEYFQEILQNPFKFLKDDTTINTETNIGTNTTVAQLAREVVKNDNFKVRIKDYTDLSRLRITYNTTITKYDVKIDPMSIDRQVTDLLKLEFYQDFRDGTYL